jgi:hypothetical protein
VTDEGRANDWVPQATSAADPAHDQPDETGQSAEPGQPAEPALGDARPGSAGRTAAFAAGRALVVLVAATVGYQFVVPTHHVVRNRLSLLVITKPGIAAFDKTKPQAGAQDDTQTGLAALTSAAKRSPNQTGLYSVEWSPSQTSAAGVVAFLFPDAATAATAEAELRTQQLSAKANAANSLTRTDTFTVPGAPGSAGSVFSPSSKSEPTLSTALLRQGRVVSLTEVIGASSSAKADSITLAVNENARLRQVAPGFTLKVTRYPTTATILWGVGAALLAALAGLVPILWRRRRERRRLAYEAELASRVVVGGKVIVKHRR